MEPMSGAQMIAVMQMDDTARFGVVRVDQLEWHPAAATLAWDAQAWYGGDYNKLLLRTEGERSDGSTEAASAEVLWQHTAFRWWSVLSGVRHDFGDGPTRTWAAFGIDGLAPQWLDAEATFYLGEQDRTALRAHLRYDLLLTQRLILQPQLEANLYGKDDSERGIGAGLSDIQAGLRVRYEFRRELAPYVGVEWRGLFGSTADLARSAGRDASDTQFVVGLHLWF
jgi:copper resistance protein B